jgi:hypothetical protein
MQFTAGVVDGVTVFSVSLYRNLGRTARVFLPTSATATTNRISATTLNV